MNTQVRLPTDLFFSVLRNPIMETFFDTPAVDLIGDDDNIPTYYWMECDKQELEEHGDMTPAFFA